MAILLLKFAIPLARYELGFPRHPGPVFHRWLPDGQNDSITLADKGSTLELWFEREGFVEDGWVRFERGRLEVDLEIMSRQASLEAGALRGLLNLESVPEASMTALREKQRGEREYEEVGKRVLKILEPQLSRFLDILRTNYGQFWINGLVTISKQ